MINVLLCTTPTAVIFMHHQSLKQWKEGEKTNGFFEMAGSLENLPLSSPTYLNPSIVHTMNIIHKVFRPFFRTNIQKFEVRIVKTQSRQILPLKLQTCRRFSSTVKQGVVLRLYEGWALKWIGQHLSLTEKGYPIRKLKPWSLSWKPPSRVSG